MDETLIPVRVARKQALAEGISAFELVPAGGGAFPAFEAGAHIDVHLARGDTRFVRPYSLCGVPGETGRWEIAVLREPDSRGGSAAMHAWVLEGSTLTVSAPRNHFRLVRQAAHSLLLAGGIGITPLLAMAEQLHRDGASFELHHCTRTLARTPFRERLAAPGQLALLQRIQSMNNLLGTSQSPHDAFLVLRGLKTLLLRMKAHEAGAKVVARFLAGHPAVARVRSYTGRPVIRLRRRLPSKKRMLRPVGLKPRKKEKYPGEWAKQLDGNAICSYPPEDLVIEDYGRFLKKKGKRIPFFKFLRGIIFLYDAGHFS